MGIINLSINTIKPREQDLLKSVILILDNIKGLGSYKLSFIISEYKGQILVHYNKFIGGDLQSIARC